jgi:hypothetical protein
MDRNALKKLVCNDIAMVFQRHLQLGTKYSFQESFEGERLCNDNFRFTKKRIPRNDNRFHPFATMMQQFNLEKLPNR